MKLRILIGAVIIIQAALLIFYTYNSYSEYGGTISVADEADIDELSSMLDSENIPYTAEKDDLKYIIKTNAKSVRILEDECLKYCGVEPVYKSSHNKFFKTMLSETIISVLYFWYCSRVLSNEILKNILLFLCYAVIIIFLRTILIYPCYIL